MLKKIYFKLIWYLTLKRMSKHTSLIKKALCTKNVFKYVKKPNTLLSNCAHYWITVPCDDLHSMLLSLELALKNFKSSGTIQQLTSFNNGTVRLDFWINGNLNNQHINLFIGYQKTLLLLEELDNFKLSPTQRSYLERKIKKQLETFLTIFELFGEMILK